MNKKKKRKPLATRLQLELDGTVSIVERTSKRVVDRFELDGETVLQLLARDIEDAVRRFLNGK